jgi:hypothetical protein
VTPPAHRNTHRHTHARARACERDVLHGARAPRDRGRHHKRVKHLPKGVCARDAAALAQELPPLRPGRRQLLLLLLLLLLRRGRVGVLLEALAHAAGVLPHAAKGALALHHGLPRQVLRAHAAHARVGGADACAAAGSGAACGQEGADDVL